MLIIEIGMFVWEREREREKKERFNNLLYCVVMKKMIFWIV